MYIWFENIANINDIGDNIYKKKKKSLNQNLFREREREEKKGWCKNCLVIVL